MKAFYRKRKVIARFLLIEFIFNVFYVYPSKALTSGTHQPEYTSYEPNAASDLVNLATGDFTCSLPILNVPSPEGGFSLPLSYHSGIGLEDEASWVGLGWNINVGAINRSKVGTADDALDEQTPMRVTDPGGSGYVKNYGFYQKSWDSNKGYGGSINYMNIAGYSWTGDSGPLTKPRNLKDGNVMGLTFNKDKTHFNPTQFAQGLMAVGMMAGSGVMGNAPLGPQLAFQGVTGAISAAQVLSARNMGGTSYGQVGEWITETNKSRSHIDYKYWLDATRTEHAYGALYLGQMAKNTSISVPNGFYDDQTFRPRLGTPGNYTLAPLFRQGVYYASGTESIVSDMHMYVEPGAEYAYTQNPTSIAYDAYSVMGPGVSGSMAPYRPDVGSLIYPKKMSELTHKFNLYPFLEEGREIDKIQFRFEGELSNTYRYHDSGGPGITQSYSDADNRLYYQTQDPKLNLASQRVEANRTGLYNTKLAQARHVEWFSNQEMASGLPQVQGKIIGYQPDNTNELPFTGYKMQGEKIGAFAITAPDGTTYHYSLPVYNIEEYNFRGVTGQEAAKYAEISNANRYATSWLLTSITGPDFIDRGVVGQLDREDLGYWVKFDYGRLTTSYNWRFPYVGYTKEDGYSSYSKGRRETYYLNSIQTRTHTALFFKDIRKDGRAAYRRSSTNSVIPGMKATDEVHPASSLLLREIVLLNNADYDALRNQGFGATSQAGRTATATYLNAPQGVATSVTSSLEDLYDVYDIAQNSSFRSFLDQKAIRRVVFNTSYQLCPGTFNSFDNAAMPPNLDGTYLYANRLGKLTLNSVSCYASNNQKLMPDFRFEYNSPNPGYNSDYWDGWGAYNSSGYYTHAATNSDPTAWHLTDIVTPLGGRTIVTYESDNYSSISGEPILQRVPITGFSTNGYDATHGFITINTSAIAPYNLNSLLANGAQVTIKDLVVKQKGSCWDAGGSFVTEREYAISPTQQVQGVAANGFVITRPSVYGGHGNSFQGCGTCTWSSISGYLEVRMPQKQGGNVRVAAITARDEANNEYKTLYRYTVDGTTQGASSGVVAQEPAFISTVEYPFYHLFDFPSTSVLYNKVHVLEGIHSDGSYASRTEYTFTTPRSDMVQVRNTTSEVLSTPDKFTSFFSKINNAKRYYYDVESHTLEIGRLERIRLFDKDNTQVGQSLFEYTSSLPNNQGLYTTGSILSEFEREGTCTTGPCPPSYFKYIRTNKTYYPNVLKTIRTTNNGISTTNRNTAWDFITGAVLETISEDALGNFYKAVAVPAYTRYPALRSKAENASNKHVLSPITESSTYRVDSNGTPQELMLASAETWSNNWTRRVVNSSGQFETAGALLPVWRPQTAYAWLAQSASSTGGTPLAAFTSFKWEAGATQHPAWQKVGELTRVNEYSASAEMRDVLSSTSSAIKFGYGQSHVISQVSNARYGEFAYSGAEDGSSTSPFFGGEISGAQSSSTEVSHTGRYSLKLSAATPKGFVFTTPIGEQEGVKAGRSYRAAVWIHRSDIAQQSGQLVASILEGSTTSSLLNVTLASNPLKQAGDWCLVQGYFTVPSSATGKRLEVSCQTRQGTVYFDDFRFAPVDAASTAIVYDTQTWNPVFQLDNNNLYTQLEYDARGQLVRKYVETLSATSPRKLVSERLYNYSRDRQYTITATVGSGNGSITPTGASTLGIGDAITVTATSSSCSWALSPTFQVDNVSYGSPTTLTDGTQIRVENGALLVRNIAGNHAVQVNFTDLGYMERGTWFEAYCETNSIGCYTGNSIWLQADGCGGYVSQEIRPASSLQCTNPPDSDCDLNHN